DSTDINYKLARESGISISELVKDDKFDILNNLLLSANILVDSLLGTGKIRPIEGTLKLAMREVKRAREENSQLHIIAVDVPSGLNADTGSVDPSCFNADTTVTLGCPKLGLFHFPGANKIGKLITVDIDIPHPLTQDISTEVITSGDVNSMLPKRPPNANKGTFGKVLVIGGSINYIGAPYLACCGAIRVGAGLVTLAAAQSLIPILASKLTEVTYLPLPESESGGVSANAAEIITQQISDYNVLLIGCGIGQNPSTIDFFTSLISSLSTKETPQIVLDADALNILSKNPRWWKKITADTILTPHPGEMSRLLNIPIPEIQSRRIEITRDAARKWQKFVILKGAHTIVAAPSGEIRISPFINPGLASAGTGDVLAGIIAGLLAQGIPPLNAASCGVYLHGMAGEVVQEQMGSAGILASDLLPILPLTIKKLKD
ncbi:MAG: NAD(P)H-hydrate dehydratase, partial [Dehalococcoidia bacterium]|nr:NAD(P)H-hydrate dehydratase [Dehalococcoidia bacterium]